MTGSEVAAITKDAACQQCGGAAQFSYQTAEGMRWFCAEHRLNEWYADARQEKAVPVNNGIEVEVDAPEQWSLEELVIRFQQRVDREYRLVERLKERISDTQLELGQMLLGMRQRVESGEVGDLAAVDWWGWFEDNVKNASRKQAERWLAIAAAENPEAAALEYRERHAGYNRAYRERRNQKLLAATERPLSRERGQPPLTQPPSDAAAAPMKMLPIGTSKKPKPTPADIEIIEKVMAMLERLTWSGLGELITRIARFYRERHR